MAGNDLHVLKIDLAIAKPGEVQPQADEATRRLFEETSSAIVKIETATATGTGFAVNRPG